MKSSSLVYLHGSGHTQDSFHAQSEHFAGSDALSLPGHPHGRPLASVGELALWLHSYLSWRNITKAIVAGNSLGGAIALQWALTFPDQAAGLILIGTGARLRVSDDIFSMLDNDWPQCIDSLVDFSLAKSASPILRSQVKAWHLLVGCNSTRTDYTACNAFDVMSQLPELNIPSLILVGEHDVMTPVKYSTYLHEHIRGSSMHVLGNAGHLAMLEQPVETNRAIETFLASLP